MVTFPFTGERLDWVLVSSDFEIVSVESIEAKLSDHRPIRAVVKRAATSQNATADIMPDHFDSQRAQK